MLLATDRGPAVFDAATGRLTTPSGGPPVDRTADPPPRWTMLRSGDVVYLHREIAVQDGVAPPGVVYRLDGRRLRKVAKGSVILPAAVPGHVLVVTYRDVGAATLVELDSAGRQIGPRYDLPDGEVLVGMSGGRILIRRWTDAVIDVWDLRSRQVRSRLPGSDVVSAADGVLVRVSCPGDGCTVSGRWPGVPGRRRWPVRLGALVSDVRISPDGERVALYLREVHDDVEIAQRLAVLELKTGVLHSVPGLRLSPNLAFFYDWAPDSGGLVFAPAGHSRMALWRLGDNELQLIPDRGPFVNGVVCIEGC